MIIVIVIVAHFITATDVCLHLCMVGFYPLSTLTVLTGFDLRLMLHCLLLCHEQIVLN